MRAIRLRANTAVADCENLRRFLSSRYAAHVPSLGDAPARHDKAGALYELDIWKVTYQPLLRLPDFGEGDGNSGS